MTSTSLASAGKIEELLGSDASLLLDHSCSTIPKDDLHLPGLEWVN